MHESPTFSGRHAAIEFDNGLESGQANRAGNDVQIFDQVSLYGVIRRAEPGTGLAEQFHADG